MLSTYGAILSVGPIMHPRQCCIDQRAAPAVAVAAVGSRIEQAADTLSGTPQLLQVLSSADATSGRTPSPTSSKTNSAQQLAAHRLAMAAATVLIALSLLL